MNEPLWDSNIDDSLAGIMGRKVDSILEGFVFKSDQMKILNVLKMPKLCIRNMGKLNLDYMVFLGFSQFQIITKPS